MKGENQKMEHVSFEERMGEVTIEVVRRTIKLDDELSPLSESERSVLTRVVTMCESLLRIDDAVRKISDVREELLALTKKKGT